MRKITFITSLTLALLWALPVLSQDNGSSQHFKPTYKINGRIQYDFEYLKYQNVDNWFNGNEFRRLHLSVAGKVAKNLKYKAEVNIAHGKIGFRDVYIKYNAGKYGSFGLGSMAEPTGLNMVTSSKYISFFERAMLTSLQNFKWGAGFHYSNFHLFDGRAGFQMALTNNGDNSEGFKDPSLEKGVNIILRATGTLIKDDEHHRLVHIGVNYDHRPYKDLSFRPENHMGSKYEYVFDGGENRSAMGMELGSTFGPLSLQAEYKTQKVGADNKDYQMTGYYGFVSYFLTGEHRPYKHAAFGRVKPLHDVFNGGTGAVELLLRYSHMDASQDVLDVNLGLPGNINNITAGINWYLNSHTRFMYNYVLSKDGNQTLGDLTGHLLRFQVDF